MHSKLFMSPVITASCIKLHVGSKSASAEVCFKASINHALHGLLQSQEKAWEKAGERYNNNPGLLVMLVALPSCWSKPHAAGAVSSNGLARGLSYQLGRHL
jgi:hypothetical protein